ncbi:13061_t:CDS:2, partial [Cetraspora pellucida]
ISMKNLHMHVSEPSSSNDISNIEISLDKNNSIDTEGEYQTDSYWVLGSHCPLCKENHMNLEILFDEILEAYPKNSKLIQELKTQFFTLPIPWNN